MLNSLSIAYTIISACVAALLIGCLYEVAAWYSPFATLNIALTIIAATLLGLAVAKFAITFIMPSQIAVFLAGTLAGLIALYAAWGINAWFRVPGMGINAFRPQLLIAYAGELYLHGIIEVAGHNDTLKIQGAGLITLWIAEALALTVGSGIMATKMFRSLAPPLCTECRKWQHAKRGLLRLRLPTEFDAIANKIAAGEFAILDELPNGSIDDDPHIRIDVGWCPNCSNNCVAAASIVSLSSEPTEMSLCHNIQIPTTTLENMHTRATNLN